MKHLPKSAIDTLKTLERLTISIAGNNKQIESDALNRKFDTLKGEDSGIEGSDENGNFKY